MLNLSHVAPSTQSTFYTKPSENRNKNKQKKCIPVRVCWLLRPPSIWLMISAPLRILCLLARNQNRFQIWLWFSVVDVLCYSDFGGMIAVWNEKKAKHIVECNWKRANRKQNLNRKQHIPDEDLDLVFVVVDVDYCVHFDCCYGYPNCYRLGFGCCYLDTDYYAIVDSDKIAKKNFSIRGEIKSHIHQKE